MEELIEDEKRQKFLERNRAAAARCRLKKKMKQNSIESKAEELAVRLKKVEVGTVAASELVTLTLVNLLPVQ